MADVKATKITRNKLADFLNIGTTATPDWRLLGYGVNSLNENNGAQMEKKTYVNEVTASNTVKSYDSSFGFDFDLSVGGQGKWDTEAVEDITEIGELHKTGTDAEREYLRVKRYKPAFTGSTRYFEARKFNVAVEVSNTNGAGGEQVVCTGNLACIGDPVVGYYDTVNKQFYEGTLSLGSLTVTSEAGTTIGNTKVTVSPTLTVGNLYVYKTAATVTVPTLGADCSTGYTVWDGTSDITATAGNQIVIVEVDANNLALKAGVATVTAK
ncbi:hypothetical protein CLSAB_19410 [Clostridium saccharobutylicum]|uniref:hypothetical protein n=1 Tax=Clostridium saccharobutylicum TaxID=169679 RepID=UPI00098C3E52|nr:hypothetical protein [Clostridium saccharobutylicum]OOM17221.1 hypothetical protein CLSAB_19410 [Clostridium saccharobutylicum]